MIEQLLRSLLPVLQFVHDNGVIHRDVKPENILRRLSDGQLVLVDFGAAKHTTGTALLKTGTMIGSAEYITPEQARGKGLLGSGVGDRTETDGIHGIDYQGTAMYE